MSFSATDHRFMQHALVLGRRGLGQVSPWPSVGCVLVKDGRIVGRGRSDLVTRRHAERVALDQAGDAARGATAYVTLEPCAHTGSTPPCCDALIAAGISRCVVAIGDPNPLVAGQGLARMEAAGIRVELGCEADAARDDHAGFLKVQTEGLPFLTLKLATTLDGKIATATGESQWITGPEARRMGHLLRARHDAVMVGGGTLRADNPTLNVRGLGPVRQPARVIVTREPKLSAESHLAQSVGIAPVYLCTRDDGAAPESVRVLPCGCDADGVDLIAAMRALAREGITRVYCEGGGALAAGLIKAGLVDELAVFSAGCVIGADGRSGMGALALDHLADAPRFLLKEHRAIGGDVFTLWRRAAPGRA